MSRTRLFSMLLVFAVLSVGFAAGSADTASATGSSVPVSAPTVVYQHSTIFGLSLMEAVIIAAALLVIAILAFIGLRRDPIPRKVTVDQPANWRQEIGAEPVARCAPT